MIKIRMIEPIIVRGSGEFGPYVIGSRNFAESLFIPRPSTIAGMLGSIFFHENDNGTWREKLKKIFDNQGIQGLIGPLIVTDKLLYPFRFGDSLALVENKKELLEVVNSIIQETHDYWEPELYSLFRKYSIERYFKSITKVGIALDRDKKITKESYLYYEKYVMPKEGLYFSVIVLGDDKNLSSLDGRIVNLGGERRVIQLQVTSPTVYADKVNDINYVENKCASYDYYLTLTPLILKENVNPELILTGKVEKISLGYDISHGKRKEMVNTILEGSIVKKDVVLSMIDTNYSFLGYNTVLPLLTVSDDP
ncbi:type III-B CRISPR module-associated Cmr3 family protein [Saccharolobus sp. E5-1-F]|uniref:type III-B CRISPR module-associated Cmr3 family protein n=1 Tax=Saccharolobus sp. E5-1-F TaxID=2663019 RepID=UPI001EE8CD74|nr:type III-B CRISPR module-associated Cmr3 family protein [Sulfolobus sp. E5-1-F]